MHDQVSAHRRDGSRYLRPALVFASIVLYAGVLGIFVDLASNGPLLHVDAWVSNIWTFKGAYHYPYADWVDRIGQRLICVPLLIIVAWIMSRRIKSLRPLIIAVLATFLLNFAVGVIKLASGRESPRTGGPAMFAGDNVLFPSGHTANVIFHYGLVVALLIRYGNIRPWLRRVLIALVAFIFLLMTFVSVYRHTHWLSDLVAGGMIGTSLLCLSLAADREWSQVVARLRRLAGPTWVVVEWPIRLIRPHIVRTTGRPTTGLPRARVPDKAPDRPAARAKPRAAQAGSAPPGRGPVPGQHSTRKRDSREPESVSGP
ncbi:MAG TPA: phosphatase PAP2 family protein [Actinopolymorphaceae bacterium]|nr:phosphatase PAP2 family protein [Actinopolymorphaceae bacterium]